MCVKWGWSFDEVSSGGAKVRNACAPYGVEAAQVLRTLRGGSYSAAMA